MKQSYRPYERVDPVFDGAIRKIKADKDEELSLKEVDRYYVDYWLQAPFKELPPVIAIKLFFHVPEIGIDASWSALKGSYKAASGEDPGTISDEYLLDKIRYCDDDMLLSALRSEIAAQYGSNKQQSYNT